MPRRNQQTAAPVEQPTEEARETQRQAPPAPVEEHATQPETAQTAGQQGETTAPTVEPGRRELTMCVTIKEGDPERDTLATADVDIDGICTLRNVRIKNGDYGPRVTLPMTQMPVTAAGGMSPISQVRKSGISLTKWLWAHTGRRWI